MDSSPDRTINTGTNGDIPQNGAETPPPPYSETSNGKMPSNSDLSRVQVSSPERRVSFSLHGGQGMLLQPGAGRQRKHSREMAVQTEKGPRVSFSLDVHPFFPERTPPGETKYGSTMYNNDPPSRGGRSPSPRVSFSAGSSNIDEENICPEGGINRAEYESSLSPEPPRRPSRQRRSGTVDTPHMGMSATFLEQLQATENGHVTLEQVDGSEASSETLEVESISDDRNRKASYDSQFELGQINKCYQDDSYIENIQNIIQDVNDSEMRVGRWSKEDTEDNNNINDESETKTKLSRTPSPYQDTTDGTNSPISFLAKPSISPSPNLNGKKSILKKTIPRAYEQVYVKPPEETPEENSQKNKKANNTLASHVRKDSIALTSEKMGQIREIRRQYNSSKKNSQPIWKRKDEVLKKYQLHLFVGVMLGLILIVVSIGWHFHDRAQTIKKANQKIYFDPSKRKFIVSSPDDTNDLHGNLGVSVPSWQSPFHCLNEDETHDFMCLKWKNNAILRIQHFGSSAMNCYNITWTALRHDLYPEDCYSIGSAVWYGPANTTSPDWSLKGINFSFDSASLGYYPAGTFGSSIEYYWISSQGGSIIMDKNVPLKVSWNKEKKGKICMASRYHGHFYGEGDTRKAVLNYTVCNGNSITATQSFARSFLPVGPARLPAASQTQYPVYSTAGAKRSLDINDSDITNLAHSVNEYQLNCSTIEIDGHWEKARGDFYFDASKFDNMSSVADTVSSMGFSLSLKFNPHFTLNSKNFPEGILKGYFTKDPGDRVPGLVNWSGGLGTLLDITNTAAESWVREKLVNIASTYKIKSFSLAYPGDNWLPFNPTFSLSGMTPGRVKEMFSSLVTSFTDVDADMLDSTSQSQNKVAFVKVPTRLHVTKERTCITGVIETSLNLGILGYPYVIVDGRFSTDATSSSDTFFMPDRNLFIRWIQMAAFFPSMKYSIPPWSYDDECVRAARNASAIHQKLTAAIIRDISKDIQNGGSIIRPLWWIDPMNPDTYTIEDEFLVGNSLLVAPILCEGSTERDVYIPRGIWSDPISGRFIQGGRWLRNYKAEIHQIPYFIRKEVYGEENIMIF